MNQDHSAATLLDKMTVATPVAALPETFRIPKPGDRDPVFGLARSFYFGEEAAGRLRLIRLRKPGNTRGVTLVPVAAVRELIARAAVTA